MARGIVAVSTLALSGCAPLFGLDETSGPPDAPLPPRATFQLTQLTYGATVESAPADLTGQTAVYYVPDDVETSGLRRIEATLEGTDTYVAEVPEGVRAAIEFSLPGAAATDARRMLALPARDIRTLTASYQNGPAVADQVAYTVTLTLPTAFVTGEALRLYAIGPWASRALVAGTEAPTPNLNDNIAGPVLIPYNATTFTSTVGARPLPAITSSDRVIATRYTAGNNLTAAADASVTQDSITATLVDNPHTPIDLTIDPMGVASRLGMASPAGATLNINWNVFAAPAWRYANNEGIPLRSGALDPTSPTTLTLDFGNPFTALGWNTIFTWGSNRQRMFTPAGQTLAMTLSNGLNHYMVPAAGGSVALDVGMPVLVLVNGTPLTSDGLTVTLDPNRSFTLSSVLDRTSCTYYQYNAYELVPNGEMPPTALAYKLAYVAVSDLVEQTLPAGVLQTGKTYTIRAHCYLGGYPTFATGDLTNRELPLSVGYLDSGVFTVAAP